MASSYTNIGTELMATGENAGTWGTKTNTNIQILEEAINGYVSQALTSGGTVALTYTDGSTGDVARHAVIALTGALSGNAVVKVPANEKVWIIDNQSTNAYTVTVRVNGQSGVTWGTSDKGTKILYANGTDVVDTGTTGGVGVTDHTILRSNGFTVMSPKAPWKIRDKITSVNTALLDANGDRRTFIHPRCKELIKALRTLTYAPNTGLPNKNLGVDHAFDAFGYLCLQQFNLAKPETLGQTAFRIY